MRSYIIKDFNAFSFDPHIAAGIIAAGYSTPTPIQIQAIPNVMQGHDLVGLAQTGTGKTAAFVLPMLHRLMQGKQHGLRALIIAPTRELAEQIHQSIEVLGAKTGMRSATVYGGVGMQQQIQLLKRADIAVACPGRLLDHIQRRNVVLSGIEILVLDEADQMFDMGFLPDIRRILSHMPQTDRQTLLFSATMPDQIRRLTGEILKNPQRVQVASDTPAATVSHTFFPVAHHLKTELLIKLLGSEPTGPVLIFTRTKHRARQLGGKLAKRGYRSTSLQGNLSQSQRQKAMDGFKSGQYQVLVATDIAARGIDVTDISHVINFDMPATPETYIHRIGRTGRAERNGEAFTLYTEEDRQLVKAVYRTIGRPVSERILKEFDYDTPKASTGPQQRHGGRRQPAGVRKGQGRNRRSADGVFAWLSPRKLQMESVG